MNTASSLAFRLNLILLVLTILLVSVAGALGMVYLRVQIEQTARRIQQSEVTFARLEREERYLDARIAHLHQPRELVALMNQHDLDLRPSHPEQVVHARMRAPRPSPLQTEGGILTAEVTGRNEPRVSDRRDEALSINVTLLETARRHSP